MTAQLAVAWLAVAQAAGASGDLAATGVRLLESYGDPKRGYHDLQHLREVLDHVEAIGFAEGAPDLTAVRLAAWFHDAVYEGRDDDERRSAAFARQQLVSLHMQSEVVDEVVRLVTVTAHHVVTAADVNAAVLCDADLAILGSDPERYASYAAGVRRDYAHVDDATFAPGRADVLRRLLSRPALYATAYGRTTWEERARHNMETELMLLNLASPR